MTRKYLYIITTGSMLCAADLFLIVSVSHGTRHGLLERNFLTQYAARNGHFFAVWSAMIDEWYIRHYHRGTIRQIITSWAPAHENNTESYVQLVSRETGINPDAPILFEDKPTMCAIVQAMARVEVGQSLPLADIEKGYDLA